MEVYTLIQRDIKESLRPLGIMLLISGIANALLIGIVNASAENVANSQASTWFFSLFLCIFAVIIFSKRYVLDRSSFLIENILYQIRMRITDKIRHTELSTLESVGTSPLYARLTTDVITISNLSSYIINSAQGFIMICFTLLYVSFVSFWAFVIIITLLALSVIYTYKKINEMLVHWRGLSVKDNLFFEKLSHILGGFKEIKVNRRKNEEVFQDYLAVNKNLKDTRITINKKINFLIVLSQVCLFLILGSLLFILPKFHPEHAAEIFKVTAALLFIAGPMENVMISIEHMGNANVAARNIMELEAELETELSKNKAAVEAQSKAESFEQLTFFDSITFDDLSYSYPPTKDREHIFTVGPANLSFRKGELIFITGGNGSGKSTLLKLITGLYMPKSGRIVLDSGQEEEQVVNPLNYQQYRNLFATIFFDFHLFDKLYGMQDINPNLVNHLLRSMELPEEKVVFRDGGFSNLNLSSGQRKRLALASNLVEDKPIYVFDEVAADLDPEFRDKYYYEILKELKERHKTVIVVSHDRHYWNVPDRIFEMSDGAIRELNEEEIKALSQVTEVE